MFRRPTPIARPLSDLVIAAVCWLAAYGLASVRIPTDAAPLEDSLWALPFVLGPLAVVAQVVRLYRTRPTGTRARLLRDVVRVNVISALVILAYLFYDRTTSYSRGILTAFFLLNTCAMASHHLLIQRVARLRHARGEGTRRCLIVGTGSLAVQLAAALRRNAWTGLSVVGFLDCEGEGAGVAGRAVGRERVLGTVEDLSRLVETTDIAEVLVALPLDRCDVLPEIDDVLSRTMVTLTWVPDTRTVRAVSNPALLLDDLPVLPVRGAIPEPTVPPAVGRIPAPSPRLARTEG